ncbi:MAG: sporulation protein YtfJ [Clostridiales bacterium]|nr:sporulation protein YtfJ [Clostridiales bacterium]
MSENAKQPLSEIVGITMEKIREMVDVNTIIGTPITAPDGTMIIPVSKVSFGFGSGGSSFGGNKTPTSEAPVSFGGGAGAGVTISPIGFLTISEGNVKMISVSAPPSNSVDRIVEMVPDVLDKIAAVLDKKKAEKQ